jgi:hypothetical protein
VIAAVAVAIASGCAGRQEEPTEAPEIGLGLDVGRPKEPEPKGPPQEVDMTLSDTDVTATPVAQPQRPDIGSFKLCGSGGADCGPGPHGDEEVSPLIAPTRTAKPPPLLEDEEPE